MKTIPLGGLGGRHCASVDDSDADYLSQWHWTAVRHGNNIYATRNEKRGGKSHMTLMHHAIVGKPPAGSVIDHANCNGLDNRRCNLRVCRIAENILNSGRRSRPASGFKGVTRHKRLWAVQITSRRAKTYIGLFKDPRHAALAWDIWALELHREFARPNFEPVINGP